MKKTTRENQRERRERGKKERDTIHKIEYIVRFVLHYPIIFPFPYGDGEYYLVEKYREIYILQEDKKWFSIYILPPIVEIFLFSFFGIHYYPLGWTNIVTLFLFVIHTEN